jgi:NhaA family Na+:H+ antiporter
MRPDHGQETPGVSGLPPEASPVAELFARRFLAPIEAVLHVEAVSGVVLLVAAALALLLASSGWSSAYHHLLEAPLGLRLGDTTVERSVHFGVNDGLMTIFFFVVGLEIRRELHAGELATRRRAMLPVAAALGGMVAPALLYLLIAGGDAATQRGWGVPMATDIAFALGVLALLGKRVPPAVRVLLLAVAIIDDIGSIIVIALFYSSSLAPVGLAVAAAGIGAILVMQRLAIRRPLLYVVPGVVVWVGILKSGIHPTVAGVIVGLMTPARAWLGPTGLVEVAQRSVDHVQSRLIAEPRLDADGLAGDVAALGVARREALAPAVRLQLLLHPWVAFGVMPIFAFANAGVPLSTSAARPTLLVSGVVVGLVVGKPLGILLASAAAVRCGLATLPRGVGGRQLFVLGLVAGIGFTMALFIAALAFPDGAQLEEAKVGVLSSSAIAMTVALLAGRLLLHPQARGARTAIEAETADAM